MREGQNIQTHGKVPQELSVSASVEGTHNSNCLHGRDLLTVLKQRVVSEDCFTIPLPLSGKVFNSQHEMHIIQIAISVRMADFVRLSLLCKISLFLISTLLFTIYFLHRELLCVVVIC